jgi:hypothetical protein
MLQISAFIFDILNAYNMAIGTYPRYEKVTYEGPNRKRKLAIF